jgi:DMSO/TMAO reductase YedYZ heme-binding membrane subunit
MNDNADESTLPANRLWQPTTARWFYVVFGSCVAYAVVRYHIVGDVPWRHFPTFILNKATSLAAVIFVAASYLIGKTIRWYDDDKRLRLVVIKFCGLMGFSLAAIHAVLALSIWTPAYFAKYFNEVGRLNLQGEIAMATGVVSLFFLSSPAITTLPMMPKALGGQRWKRTQRMGYVALLLAAAHLFALGLEGWLKPQAWPWGMPSISLLAFIAAVIPLIVKRSLVYERRRRGLD